MGDSLRSRVIPPWGTLWAEQYLIRNWDHAATGITATEQREQLVRQFLQLPEVPQEWVDNPRVPSDEEIETILAPWRSLAVRSAAATISDISQGKDPFPTIWFRAYYDRSQNAKWEEILEDTEDWPREDHVLDHPDLAMDLPPLEAYSRLLLLVPEIVSRQDPAEFRRPLSDNGYLDELREELRKEVGLRALEDRIGWVDYSYTTKALQSLACEYSVVVVGADAFRAKEVTLLLLDSRGNIVRWIRVAAEDFKAIGACAFRGMLRETDFMDESETAGVGGEYRALGEVGWRLYDVDDLLLGMDL